MIWMNFVRLSLMKRLFVLFREPRTVTGFWQCMDNIREKSLLEKLLTEDKAPWKRWDRTVPEIPDYAK